MIELLAVVAIILILAGIILPVISRAHNHTLEVLAESEAKQIETAWGQYLTEYEKWPACLASNTAYAIADDLARLLEGENIGNANPKKISFMHFARYNTSSNPISPWGKRQTSGQSYYYCKFDTDYDQTIPGTGIPTDPPADSVRRWVIVWTINEAAPPSDPHYVIGSWPP
jgi:type II secretory pathway pseudopilin PulG